VKARLLRDAQNGKTYAAPPTWFEPAFGVLESIGWRTAEDGSALVSLSHPDPAAIDDRLRALLRQASSAVLGAPVEIEIIIPFRQFAGDHLVEP
jgi:hypothetical protein